MKEHYSIYKKAEGGSFTIKEAIQLAKDAGATKVERGTDIYVGQFGLDITADKVTHNYLLKVFYY